MYLLYLASLWALIIFKSSAGYVLSPEDTYQGTTFFEKFNFFTAADPNWGFVQYQDQNTATASKLISTNDAQQVYIGVDHENTYDVNGGRGRPSIRLETKKSYQYGLFVFDLAHMPANTCGKWSAFWTTNEVDWPRWGEIDVIENIHENNITLEALHTSPGCSVSGNQISTQMTGRQTTYNCDGAATSGQGCVAENTKPNSYGKSFNDVGGGVYVMEWNNQAISIWQFGHQDIPKDLVSGAPNPAGWEQPVFTTSQGSCNIDEHFKDQKVIIDSSFCGNWAGQDAFWQQTSCYKSDPAKYPTCNSYVAANPAAYKESYWLVNSLKIYQKQASANSINSSVPEPPALPAQSTFSTLSSSISSHSSEVNSAHVPQSPAPSLSSSPAISNLQSSSEIKATGTINLGMSGIGSASAVPSSYVNGTVPSYRLSATGSTATATGSAYTPAGQAYVTETIIPIAGNSDGGPSKTSPTNKYETADGSKSARLGESSVLALIAALVLGMMF